MERQTTPTERRSRIRDLVRRDGEGRVDALAETLGVSAETIRRDLARLAREGALQKVHGGARRLVAEGSLAERMAEGAEAKARIGRRLAELVEPGETLFMDAGTTTMACADALAERSEGAGVTVVTNSVEVARRMGRGSGHVVYLLGGGFRSEDNETLGPLAIEQAARFQADRAVLTVAGLDAEAGATDASFDEAQVARAMIAHARDTTVVAHAAKMGRRAAFRVCRLEEVSLLVCDEAPPDELAAALRRVEVA